MKYKSREGEWRGQESAQIVHKLFGLGCDFLSHTASYLGNFSSYGVLYTVLT